MAPNNITHDTKLEKNDTIHYHSKCGNILKSWSSINLGDHFLFVISSVTGNKSQKDTNLVTL